MQLENSAIKLRAAELEVQRTKDEAKHLREQLEKLREEKLRLELALEEARHEAELAKEAERRAAQSLSEANKMLKRAEEELAQRLDAERRLDEIAEEMKALRARNKGEIFLHGFLRIGKNVKITQNFTIEFDLSSEGRTLDKSIGKWISLKKKKAFILDRNNYSRFAFDYSARCT